MNVQFNSRCLVKRNPKYTQKEQVKAMMLLTAQICG